MSHKEIADLNVRVAKLETQVAALMARLQLSVEPAGKDQPSAKVLDYLKRGRKIQAISQYRAEAGVGLREAKDYIDSLRY